MFDDDDEEKEQEQWRAPGNKTSVFTFQMYFYLTFVFNVTPRKA